MNKKWRGYGIICAISLAPSVQASSFSIGCEFLLLREVHETLLFCGEHIDEPNERRYQKLVGDLSSFIDANEKMNQHPAFTKSVDEIRDHLVREGQDRVCKSSDVALWRKTFLRAVSDAGMEEVGKLLSRPRDPFEGDCF